MFGEMLRRNNANKFRIISLLLRWMNLRYVLNIYFEEIYFYICYQFDNNSSSMLSWEYIQNILDRAALYYQAYYNDLSTIFHCDIWSIYDAHLSKQRIYENTKHRKYYKQCFGPISCTGMCKMGLCSVGLWLIFCLMWIFTSVCNNFRPVLSKCLLRF